jgi:hypothetical protein
MNSTYKLILTESLGEYVLWFVQDHQPILASRERLEEIKLQWIEWVESFTFTGKVKRDYQRDFLDREKPRNIMIFTDKSDAVMVKLAFDANMFG